MDRREFLRQVRTWSAGAALVPLFRVEQALAAAATTPDSSAGQMPLLTVGESEDWEQLVKSVLEPLGGMGEFVKSGHKVVVKPNIAWDRAPEYAANTNPVVVAAVVRLALDAGASQVMVFDRTCNEQRRCYASSGIRDAVEAIGDPRATCPFIDNRRFVPVDIARGKALERWEFYRDALEADCYINVPVAKHHGLTKLTLTLKNIMGVIGGNRGQIHTDIAQKLADLNTVIKPKLHIMDATRILLRRGPRGGRLEDVETRNTIMASVDPVACDAKATTLFNLQPDQVPSTVTAHQMGLGEMDLEKIRIVRV